MCEFPSWIETDEGEVLFLTDKEIAKLVKMDGKSSDWYDYIGHHAIRENLAVKGGRNCELSFIPKEVQSALLAGKMKRMAKIAGYDYVLLRGIHEIREGHALVLGWAIVRAWNNSQVTARDNSQVYARDNSKINAQDNSQIYAWDNSQVYAQDNSQINAQDNSQVYAWDNSKIIDNRNK